MRMRLVMLLLLVACGNKVPDRPSAAEWAKLDGEGRCRATFPRAADCTDELMAEQLRSIGGGSELADEMLQKFKDQPTSDRDAVKIHKVSCLGDRIYADALYECWNREGCAALAKCVYKTK
jgi:hypothetical protein